MIKGTAYIGVQRLMSLSEEKLAKARKLALHYRVDDNGSNKLLYKKLNAMGLYWFPSERLWKKLGGE